MMFLMIDSEKYSNIEQYEASVNSALKILINVPKEYKALLHQFYIYKALVTQRKTISTETEEVIPEAIEIQSYLRIFVSVLYDVLRELNIQNLNFDKAPNVIVTRLDTKEGFYKLKDHTIYLNYNNGFLSLLNGFKSKVKPDFWRTDARFRLLAPSLPCSTLIHEIGHAWRKDAHTDEGAHSSRKIVIDDYSYMLSYDEGIQKVYSHAILNKFYDRLYSTINKL